MSVNKKNYVVIGIDIIDYVKANHVNGDDLESLEDLLSSKELELIYDGMSGNYCVIGKVLACQLEDDYEDFMMSFNLDDSLKELKYNTDKEIESVIYTDLQSKLIIFTHYC